MTNGQASKPREWWQLEVSLPDLPEVDEDDIDAQLFSYVANAPAKSSIYSIADLNDEWVKANFDDLSSIAQLRVTIKERLESALVYELADIKYRNCADALIVASGVEVSAEEIDEAVESVSNRIELELRSAGVSKAVYMENEGLSEEDYAKRIRKEAAHDIAFNKAIDAVVTSVEIKVADEEIADYLSCEEPSSFLDGLKTSGQLEQARTAAKRVKAMRQVIENANVVTDL